jgi:hypothetical protein
MQERTLSREALDAIRAREVAEDVERLGPLERR